MGFFVEKLERCKVGMFHFGKKSVKPIDIIA